MSQVRLIPRPAPNDTVGVQQAVPLTVYVHLPWCLRKCPYCDFNSHEAARFGSTAPGVPLDPAEERRYLAALQTDLEQALPSVWGRPVQSVFIGGGTPSLFSPHGIGTLITLLRTHLKLAPDAEITLEANPGTFEQARFRAFHDAGITRLSLGVQSFDDDALQRIGRVHDGAQARAAAACAAECFDTFNLDLMYALPGQNLAALNRDLDVALSFAPPHLSLYHLTMEPNTAFARHPPAGLPDEDEAAALADCIAERLTSAGLSAYEVSAWSRPGHRCRHNLNYWTFGDYLGLGAGAHGKLSFHDRIERQVRRRHPTQYMELMHNGAPDAVTHQIVTAGELPFEFMLNALRLMEGVPTALFSERTGLPLSAIRSGIAVAVERGLMDPDPTRLAPTALGSRFLNDLQAIFLPDTGSGASTHQT